MATAEELLDSLTDELPDHDHPVVDSDSYFIIDPITRAITSSVYEVKSLMQYDHNSERYTFELPRYIEGHDMLLCNRVRAHFNNIEMARNDKGTYTATGVEYSDVAEMYDLAANPDDPYTVISSWTITRQATQLVGILSFLVQYMCVDENDNITYEWHSDIYSNIQVKAGRNNSEAAVIEYSNVIEQWRSKLFGAGDTVIAEIAAKGEETLAMIPDNYTEMYDTVSNINDTYVTKTELSTTQAAVDNLANDVLTNCATKEELSTTQAAVDNLSDEVSTGFATKEELHNTQTAVDELSNELSTTQTAVDELSNGLSTTQTAVDELSKDITTNYATKTELSTMQTAVGDLSNEVTTNYATKTELSETQTAVAELSNEVSTNYITKAVGGVEHPDYPGCYYRMVGDEKAWLNPPMVVDEEYRTTERWLGSPVYTKVINWGHMPNKTFVHKECGVDATKIIEIRAYAHYASNNSKQVFPLHSLSGGGITAVCWAEGTKIYIQTFYDESHGTAYVIIKYTKE